MVSAQQQLLAYLLAVFSPLQAAALDQDYRARLASAIGLPLDEIPAESIESFFHTFSQGYQTLIDLFDNPPDNLADYIAELKTLSPLFSEVRKVPEALADLGLTLPAEPEQLTENLLQYLITDFLESRYPIIYRLGVLLSIILEIDTEVACARRRIDFPALSRLLKDPVGTLKEAYFQDNKLVTIEDANRAADKLFPPLGEFIKAGGGSYGYDIKATSAEADNESETTARMLLVMVSSPIDGASFGSLFSFRPAEFGDPSLVIGPLGNLSITLHFDTFELASKVDAAVPSFAVGPGGLSLAANSSTAPASIEGSIVLTKVTDSENEESDEETTEASAFVVGGPAGTHLEIGEFEVRGDLSFRQDGDLDFGVLARASNTAFVIAPGDGDGFLKSVLPAEGLRFEFGLGLGWSNLRGVYIEGGGGLDVEFGIKKTILDVLTIESLRLALKADLESISLLAATTLKVLFGPVTVTIEGIGLKSNLLFQNSGDGNLGPVDLQLAFKPPTAIGLQINQGTITGGGYLHFDDENKQYAGIVTLVIEDLVTLTAIGLLTTRMPDGSDGFSLLLIITAEGFKPIQLGFGFTLQGVGGLLGVNRTVAVDVVRAGLKSGVLDAILFPKNPVENATQYVSDIQSVFPPAEGRHLFGPMVIIGWGTPTILTLELALLLDLPSPLRLIAVGRVRALLPSADAALIKLQMDAVGVIDFDLSEGSLDATLVDSTIAGFAVTGDMALRASWAANPGFLLAIGGFHPRFQPPPNFPALNRLALNLADSEALRLRLEVYLALTSNTAQFGAFLDLYAIIAGFTVKGDFAFDTLFNFSPFEFRADVSGAVALAYDDEALMSVNFHAALSGPAPWHASGSATFEFLGLTQIIDLLFDLGKAPSLPAFPKINLKERLREVLNDTRNWRGQLPADRSALVSFRASQLATGALVHPLGDLSLRQNVLPLKVDIEHFGNSTVEGNRYFQIAGIKSSSAPGSTASITFKGAASSLSDYFAPAHFFELDDAEQLSRPSFETMAAGFGFAAEAVALPGVAKSTALEDVSKEIEYETIIIDPNLHRTRPAPVRRPLAAATFTSMVSYSAATQSRAAGKAKYRGPTDNSVSVADTGYVIATVTDLTFVNIGGIDPVTGVAYAEADDALTYHLSVYPGEAGRYQVAGVHEAH